MRVHEGRQRTGLQSMDNRNNTIAGWVLFAGICALGLSIGEVNATLAISFGSAYANDFTREGRVLRVLLQADAASASARKLYAVVGRRVVAGGKHGCWRVE